MSQADMSKPSQSEMQEVLMHIADLNGIPRQIFTYMLEDSIIASVNDIRLIPVEDVPEVKASYVSHYVDDSSKCAIWTSIVSRRLAHLINWLNSYHKTFGMSPDTNELTAELFQTLPEEVANSNKLQGRLGTYRDSAGPGLRMSNITSRRSYGSMTSQTSQVTSKQNVKVSISDYPKFSGKAKDWVAFERKFRSVASSQGFDYVLQDKEFEAMTLAEEKTYELDSAFIYDAFQNSWADSMNFYLVEQNKKNKNGRKVYIDAKNYFRGAAVKDAILTENMDDLVNYKLTHTTPNGAEGFNNKFNDVVNSLEQQGHKLAPKILKGIYLGNIKDKTYENIKDQAAANEELDLPDIQAQILRKYLSVQGERRAGATLLNNKRFVNNMSSGRHVHFDLPEEVQEYVDQNYFDEDQGTDDSNRNIFATNRKGGRSPSKSESSFPMIPKEHYDALPDEVKDILHQQHAYYREKIKSLQ